MRILIVGLGSIARKHIAALKRLDKDVEIFALRRNDGLNNVEEGVTNVFEPIQDIDFVIISNPTSEHGHTIRKLLDLKVPLFIEKPLFNELNYDNLIKKINHKGVKTYVACNLRFLECIEFIKRSLGDKRINEVNIYCGSYLPSWRDGVDYRKVYSANKEMGGGVHIDLIHEIDYMVHLFGFPNHVTKTFKNNSSLDISAFDYANYTFEYDRFVASVVLNYYRRIPKRKFEIICEDGEFEIDLLSNTVYWNNEIVYKSSQGIKDTYLPQMNYFINKVCNTRDEEYYNNINEAYQILKLCLED